MSESAANAAIITKRQLEYLLLAFEVRHVFDYMLRLSMDFRHVAPGESSSSVDIAHTVLSAMKEGPLALSNIYQSEMARKLLWLSIGRRLSIEDRDYLLNNWPRQVSESSMIQASKCLRILAALELGLLRMLRES